MLHVHRAERADGLVEALRGLLAEPPADPFAPELVAVPTRGHGALALAADVRPARRVARPRGRRVRERRLPAAAAARRRRGRGRLRDRRGHRPVAPRARGLAAAGGRGGVPARAVARDAAPAPRRARTATRRAARGASRRCATSPSSTTATRCTARTCSARGRRDRRRRGVGAEHRWQPELWRRLRERIGVPDIAARVEGACARLRAEPGIARPPAAAVGLRPHPPARRPAARPARDRRRPRRPPLPPAPVARAVVADRGRRRRSCAATTDPTPTLPRSRLLASWGRDAREMQLVLGAGRARRTTTTRSSTARTRCWAASRPTSAPTASRRDAPAELDERPLLDPDDRSVQVHACHGRARQVEVLRDAILHLLEEDPTLEPRDVIVMCPDIETFASLIQATFGAGEVTADDDEADVAPRGRAAARPARAARRPRAAPDEPRARRRRAAHRARGGAGDRVAGARPRRPRAGPPPLRARRRRPRARSSAGSPTAASAGGSTPSTARPFKLDALRAGTWRAGLDRVLVGVAMTEEEAAALRGRPAARRRRQRRHRPRRALRRAHRPPRRGARRLGRRRTSPAGRRRSPTRSTHSRHEPARRLAARGARPAAGRRRRARRAPAATAARAARRCAALLAERLQGRPTRANFRTGHLTICTLMPMRSVPHRVVCLLGHGRGRVPAQVARATATTSCSATPHVGDRDPRSEDRQLLLDALHVGDRPLVIDLHGQRRAHERRAPARRAAERAARRRRPDGPHGGRPGARPRSSCATRCSRSTRATSVAGELVADRPWSFDAVTLEGARALEGEREPRPRVPARAARAGPAAGARGARRPRAVRRAPGEGVPAPAARDHGRRRTTTRSPTRCPSSSTAWRSGASATGSSKGVLAGAALDDCVRAEIARGALPPGLLARPVVARVRPIVRGDRGRGARAARRPTPSPARSTSASRSATGARLGGTVAGVCGDVLRTVTLLAAERAPPARGVGAAARAERRVPGPAVRGGHRRAGALRRKRRAGHPLAHPAGRRRARARSQLERLVDLWDRGHARAAPDRVPDLRRVRRRARDRGRTPTKAAPRRLGVGLGVPEGGRRARAPARLRRRCSRSTSCWPSPPAAGEAGIGWDDAELTRFGRLARRAVGRRCWSARS